MVSRPNQRCSYEDRREGIDQYADRMMRRIKFAWTRVVFRMICQIVGARSSRKAVMDCVWLSNTVIRYWASVVDQRVLWKGNLIHCERACHGSNEDKQ